MLPSDSIPNVLFICADDLNSWIGPLERYPGVKTPHIDALATRGTLFTHAYYRDRSMLRSSIRSSKRPGQATTTSGPRRMAAT